MKKFMKAIALATVLCLALSTAAFAAFAEPTVDASAKTLAITIDGVGNSEEVSLLILKDGAELASLADGDILFIDQKTSNASGNTVAFDVKLDANAVANVERVDIYSGNATYAGSVQPGSAAYQLLGDVSIKEAITEVVFSYEKGDIISETTEANDHTAVGLWMTATFTAVPDGYAPAQMVWAIQTTERRVYTDPVDISWMNEGVAAGSAIKFGASIPNGSVKQGIETLEVTGFDAIFQFVKTGEADKEAFTNPSVDNTPAARGEVND